METFKNAFKVLVGEGGGGVGGGADDFLPAAILHSIVVLCKRELPVCVCECVCVNVCVRVCACVCVFTRIMPW